MYELTLSELETIDGGFDFFEVVKGIGGAALGGYCVATTGGLGATLGCGTLAVGGAYSAIHGLFN